MFSIAAKCRCPVLKQGKGVHGVEFPVVYVWTLGLPILARALKKVVEQITLEDILQSPFVYCRDCKEAAHRLQGVEMVRLDRIAPVVLKNMRDQADLQERRQRSRERNAEAERKWLANKRPAPKPVVPAVKTTPPATKTLAPVPATEVVEGETFAQMLAAQEAHHLRQYRRRRDRFKPRMPRGGDWRRPWQQHDEDDDGGRHSLH